MKIFSTPQIREADRYTIKHEPVSSLDLMERASQAFVRCFCDQFVNTRPVVIFCGKGNNGGDGLAIARLLSERGYQVQVIIVEHTESGSADFQENYERLKNHLTPVHLHTINDLPALAPKIVIIDAILGSGLSRPAEGLVADVIHSINNLPNKVVSVDIASGLFADKSNDENDPVVKPSCTVSFQFPKLAFLLPQNAEYTGDWHIVDIGLHQDYIQNAVTPYSFTDQAAAEALVMPRKKFSHKGTFGHALIIAGSYGKMGAAVLSGKACLRSGVGLLSMHIPEAGYDIMQIANPEAMVIVDVHARYITNLPDISSYSAIGVGPGLGKGKETVQMLEKLLESAQSPLIIDADALNILSENKHLLAKLPAKTILTPHPKEFQRLAGNSNNEFERLELARDFAKKYKVIICLKGANTAVVHPNGNVHFNSTGNPGMATGGTGDVLTGIITALLAQGYDPEHAAIFGVYQHGLAGDKAAEIRGMSALIASDVVDHLGW
ncbi:MAG TPA: NAD(P)H-hydrate dehydratase [Dyadobacter sp.]|jgi:NAD(P)H-hydrate epimerase|nr:NAD(P)H-hydrate dehydratase [Dyadobacter sp.]